MKGVRGGTRYLYRLDGVKEFPDPASRFQPDGVHGAPAVMARTPGVGGVGLLTMMEVTCVEVVMRRLGQP